MKRCVWLWAGLVAMVCSAEEIRITYPTNGAKYPAGASVTYMTGCVKPANATLTCNGKPVAVYKTGSFTMMAPLHEGENVWVFKAGETAVTHKAIVAKAVPEPYAPIKPLTLTEPMGALIGETVRFACTAPAGRAVHVMVGERDFTLVPDAKDPKSYSAAHAYTTPIKDAPIVYWSEGLPDAPAAKLTVREKWPIYKFADTRFQTRARTLPNDDGDTAGFPTPGMLLQGTGFVGNYIRFRVGGASSYIYNGALHEEPKAKASECAAAWTDWSKGFAARPAGKKPQDILIVLDPGHGGTDTGAISPNGTYEKVANLRQATAIQHALQKVGFRVLMTRTDDTTHGLYERANLAYDKHADAFISCHHNATAYQTDPREVRHFICYAWNDRGTALARPLHDKLAPVSGIKDRGVSTASFAVCRNPAVPSCLIEFDFINCPEGEDAIFNSNRADRFADAFALGLLDWVNGK